MNVPDGWRAAALGEVAPEVKGALTLEASSTYELWSVPSFSTGAPETVTGSQVKSSKRPVVPGDVLLCKINPRINRVWAVGPAGEHPQVASPEWIVLRPKARDAVDASYLQLFLSAPHFREWITTEVSGVTGSHTRAKPAQVLQQPISFPPLPEQRRIVEMVEEHMAHLDAADASLASAEQRARALIASSRANLVSEGQRLGVDSTVGVHSTEVAYGSSSKTSDASDGVPVLRMGNIQDGQLDWSSLKYLPRDHAEFPKLLLRDGDLLFNRTNSAELVGKSAVFRGERSASYASYLIRVRFDDTVLPEWANLCINSPQGRAHVKSVLAQQVGQANVNGTKLKAFPLPVPPVEDQRRLLESADRARRDALRTTQTTHTTRRRSAALRRVVLAAAFSGHLTSTTDPSDLLQESIA